MPTHIEIAHCLNDFAPAIYKEPYDNVGLLIGNPHDITLRILTTLDVTEAVLDEAAENGCNLIVAHHPLIFNELKKISFSTYTERIIYKCIKKNIAVIAAHTNIDHVKYGVNYKIAQKLDLKDIKILRPKRQLLKKLTVYVPPTHTASVLEAMHAAGAGQVGNYTHCSFSTRGIGSFMPSHEAKPYLGNTGILEHAEEDCVQVLVPQAIEKEVVEAMKNAHPYEETAYFLQPTDNPNQDVGSGAIGILEHPLTFHDFVLLVKKTFDVKMFKSTSEVKNQIQKVALCGGSGSFLLNDAKTQKADVFITSDVKYHEFFDADNQVILMDIGHYETEQFTKDLLREVILKKFTNIAVLLSKVNTNPVQYL